MILLRHSLLLERSLPLMRTTTRLGPVALLLPAGCSSNPVSELSRRPPPPPPLTVGSPTSAAQARAGRISSPAEAESTAFIENAAERGVQPAPEKLESPAGKDHLSVFSNEDGIAEVTFRQADPAIESAALALDCTDENGRTTNLEIDVTVSDDAVVQTPAPRHRAPQHTLPPLDVDPMSLSVEEVAARGVPTATQPQDPPRAVCAPGFASPAAGRPGGRTPPRRGSRAPHARDKAGRARHRTYLPSIGPPLRSGAGTSSRPGPLRPNSKGWKATCRSRTSSRRGPTRRRTAPNTAISGSVLDGDGTDNVDSGRNRADCLQLRRPDRHDVRGAAWTEWWPA